MFEEQEGQGPPYLLVRSLESYGEQSRTFEYIISHDMFPWHLYTSFSFSVINFDEETLVESINKIGGLLL